MSQLKLFILCLLFSCNNPENKNTSEEAEAKIKSSQKIEDNNNNKTSETRKNTADEKWNNNIYTNTFYKFKIEFPKQWEYDNGASSNTLARAGNRKIGATYSAQIIHIVEPPKNPNNICESLTPDELKSSIIDSKILPFKDISNIKIEKGYLSNLPAYLIEFTHTVLSGQRTFIYLTKIIQCYKNSVLYQITLNLPQEIYDSEMEIMYERVINSFLLY